MAAGPASEPPARVGRAMAGARCGIHDGVPAVDLCQRCGTFLCGDCVELQGSEVFCPRCFAWQGGNAPPSRRALASLLLGILGLFTFFLPGLIGLVLARQELRRIDAGRAPEAGRRFAQAGRSLGWINFALFLVAFLILASVVALALWRIASGNGGSFKT